MRISDLLGREVVDRDGNSLGTVDDVQLVQDGPVLANFGAALRVCGLVVGRRAVGIRLGYHRAGVKGPWMLKKFFTALERRAHFVRWEQVDDYDEGSVRLAVGADELQRVADL